jgi:hypothetical protein
VESEKFSAQEFATSYLSNGAWRLGSRNSPEFVLDTETGRFGDSISGWSRSAICRFTRSISTTNFLVSRSRSACLHIFWKSCGGKLTRFVIRGILFMEEGVNREGIAYPIAAVLPIPKRRDCLLKKGSFLLLVTLRPSYVPFQLTFRPPDSAP